MVGLIWFVQVVHYPLFAHVGERRFGTYHRLHTQLTGRVVGPPMLLEAVTGVLLVWFGPDGVPPSLVALSLSLLAVVWVSTFRLQVPRHRSLASARSGPDIRGLVATNWIRTVAWTLRAGLVSAMVYLAAA
jgi:hypothetical protein